MVLFFDSFSAMISEILLSFFLLCSLAFIVNFSTNNSYGFLPFSSSWVCFSFTFLFFLCFSFFDCEGSPISTQYETLFYDSHLFFFQKFVFFLTLFVLAVSRNFLQGHKIYFSEFSGLIFFSLIGLSFICASSNLLLLFLALELQSLSLYILACFQWNSVFSSESGIKYFVLGSLSSCLLLFGFSLLYLVTGSLAFNLIQTLSLSKDSAVFSLGLLLCFSALFFKVGLFPFHFWLCDVYEGAITPVTFFFAAVPKFVLFIFIIRFIFFVLSFPKEIIFNFFFFSGFSSVFIAALAAVFQKKVKRLLAFSSISHAGFVILGISCGSLFSVKSAIFYLVFYSLMTVATFSIILFSNERSFFLRYLINWGEFFKRNFVLAVSFSLLIFSLAGIPPLVGFYSKLLILLSFLHEEKIAEALFISLLSGFGCFYYVRLIKILFFCPNLKFACWVSSSTRISAFTIAFSIAVISFFLFSPDFFLLGSFLLSLSVFG